MIIFERITPYPAIMFVQEPFSNQDERNLRSVLLKRTLNSEASAFESLYEDLAPVRFACDVLYWRLEPPLADAVTLQKFSKNETHPP